MEFAVRPHPASKLILLPLVFVGLALSYWWNMQSDKAESSDSDIQLVTYVAQEQSILDGPSIVGPAIEDPNAQISMQRSAPRVAMLQPRKKAKPTTASPYPTTGM